MWNNMKVVHIESGLGNQMLSYCEYLALKKMNPTDECYIELMVYSIPECNETISQWNGYELNHIFGIEAPNIKDKMTIDEWNTVLAKVRESKFWSKDWNFPKYITESLNTYGLNLKNIRGDFESDEFDKGKSRGTLKKLRYEFFNSTRLGVSIKRAIYKAYAEKYIKGADNQKNIFIRTDENILTGQWLTFRYKSNGIEKIKDEIEQAFQFPQFPDSKNKEFAEFLDSHNTVFIHARRGDMLSANGWCYKFGYFRDAVNYIKKRVNNPVFVFFTNTESVEWCKNNSDIFALNYKKDKVFFVDWNKGIDSFRDMQLMSHCKHGIITDSSFGWWGTYFIKNPDKITISPSVLLNTTHTI